MRIPFAMLAALVAIGCWEPPEVPTTKLPDGSFDRASAAGSLGAVHFQRCRDPNGPIGDGHITVTFVSDGGVSKAEVDSGPYPGTPTAECLVRLALAVRMRPFDGADVRVGKSFHIE